MNLKQPIHNRRITPVQQRRATRSPSPMLLVSRLLDRQTAFQKTSGEMSSSSPPPIKKKKTTINNDETATGIGPKTPACAPRYNPSTRSERKGNKTPTYNTMRWQKHVSTCSINAPRNYNQHDDNDKDKNNNGDNSDQ